MGYYKTDPKEVKIAVFNNLTNWSWDIYPEFRLEKEEVEVIRGMIINQLSDTSENKVEGIENILNRINEDYDFDSNIAFKVSKDEGGVIIEAIKRDRLTAR